MKQFKTINNITGWFVFLISAIVYLLTIESSVSLWDCGEFIACANKLEVGHPPGAPLFLMISRFFAIFAGKNFELVPVMVNIMSALASAATILFLFWTITHLVRKMFGGNQFDGAKTIVIMGSGLVGALAYTFSDTFWFSAVEGEVYALSSLFTAVVFWVILKWEDCADEPHSSRWILLIALLMGLSVGVHLLNLLAIPAIVFVIYFKKYQPTLRGVFLALFVSILVLALSMYGIIQGSVKVATGLELFSVNTLNLPVNSGMILYCILLCCILSASIYYSTKEQAVIPNTILLTIAAFISGIPFVSGNPLLVIIITIGVAIAAYIFAKTRVYVVNAIVMIITLLLIGYSSYAMIVIRSIADTPMNENAPNNPFGLLSYLNREQYGDRPLFYGPYFNAPIDNQNPYKEGEKHYGLSNGQYIVTDESVEYNYDSRFMTFFPRMYSTSGSHIQAYKEWGSITGKDIPVQDNGENKIITKPTFGENLRFFFTYQIGHMYWRYFMWNFVGRQNDQQGYGGILDGNWVSGIKPIDAIFLGNQDKITKRQMEIPSRNVYYFLPLLLGLIGMVYMLLNHKNDFWIVLLLFFFTGLAIVLYLNQTPYQPRERDYAYAGSFYAFAIWIGVAVFALFKMLNILKAEKTKALLATAVCLVPPAIMASENWDDHDRSGRYFARDFARNYLETCAPNAVLFTNGDNDTFPLWYAQEVEGIRTDVRVVCLPLLSTEWYINQMKKRAYTSAPLQIPMDRSKYMQGTRDYLPVNSKINDNVQLRNVMDFALDDSDPRTKVEVGDGKRINYIPAKNLIMPVNKQQVIANNVVSAKDTARIQNELRFTLPGGYVIKNELAVLSLLDNNDWTRPIYYSSPDVRESMGLKNFYRNEGFASRLVPVKNYNQNSQYYVDSKIMYDNLMHKYTWGRMEADDVYLDEFCIRTIRIVGVRDMFNTLAVILISENKKDSAIKVLDRCQQILPSKKIPHDYYSIQTADFYYLVQQYDKGNALLEEYANDLLDELEYFNSLDQAHKTVVEESQNRSFSLLNLLIDKAQKNKQTALVDKINARKKQIFGTAGM